MKWSIKADKQKYVEELAKTAGRASRKYETTVWPKKKVVGKYGEPEKPVNNKRRKPIPGIQGEIDENFG